MNARNFLVGHKQGHRKATQGYNNRRVNHLNLAVEKGCGACVNFVGLRVSILRRPTFDNVADEDLGPLHTRHQEQFVQEFARRPDEGEPFAIFVIAGTFADKHDPGRG